MISLYSTFRRFDHPQFEKVQRDAIESWLAINPAPEIIIVGNDFGTAEICKEYNLTHVPNVKTSASGTPYCNHFIWEAEKAASCATMLLCSGDIIIKQDTVDAALALLYQNQIKEYCVCARKLHVDITDGVKTDVRWATWQAGDYWLHTKGIFDDMPDFLIGRHKNEKWMFKSLCNKNALVDGSDVITVWHQQHPHEFNPENKELEHNDRLFKKHFVEVEKWKNTKWYKHRCNDIGFNFANWKLTEDLQVVDNPSPQRQGFQQV